MPAAAPLAPPAQGGFKIIDPTPGPEDVTSFEQAQAKALPVAPTPAAPAPSQAPRKEVQLDAPREGVRPDQFEDQWDALDKLAGVKQEPEPSKEPAKEPSKAPVDDPLQPATPAPAAPDPNAEDAALEEAVSKAGNNFKALRTAHKEALKREKALLREKEELVRARAELETKLKNGDVEQVHALSSELEQTKKAREELESQIRVLDYTKSGEFHDKYVQPLTKGLTKAYAFVKELRVTDEATGETRAATEADFKKLLSLPAQDAGELAMKMFGPHVTPRVLHHRENIIELKSAQDEARENASKLYEEHQQKSLAEHTQREQRLVNLYKQERASAEQRYPDLFKAKEGDAEALQVLEKSKELVQAALENNELDETTRVKLGTGVRMRAEAFPLVLLQLNRAKAQIEALTKKLSAYEASAPDRGDSPNRTQGDGPKDPMERALSGLEKLGRPL